MDITLVGSKEEFSKLLLMKSVRKDGLDNSNSEVAYLTIPSHVAKAPKGSPTQLYEVSELLSLLRTRLLLLELLKREGVEARELGEGETFSLDTKGPAIAFIVRDEKWVSMLKKLL